MFTASKAISASILSIALVACGGGGSPGTSNTPVITQPSTDYSCDPVATLAAAPRTADYINQQDPLPLGVTFPVTKYESWQMLVDGEQNTLNVAIVRPPSGIEIKGVNITNHGQNDAQAAMLLSQGTDGIWMFQNAMRGYISVAVARRGNFGSTGKMYYGVPIAQASATYWQEYFKYQSASVVAAMDKMANDPAYKPYMSTILLDGGSAGSDTVLQVASDSATFKAATKKAVIRMTGGIWTSLANARTISAFNEYATAISKNGTPSLWIVGDQDQISSLGAISCQFKFYNQSAGYANNFYVVPGMGHEGSAKLFTPALRQIFREYMASRGFDGFN